MRLRKAEVLDHAAVVELSSQADELHAAIQPRFFRKGPSGDGATLRESLSDPHELVLVADTVEHGLVGFVHVKLYDTPPRPTLVAKRRAHVDQLFVIESMRRQGIGRGLMTEAFAWAKAKCAEDVLLTVWDGNRAADMFYKALGFTEVNRLLGLELK